MSTVRVNDNIKKDVTPILDELGISLSEAINIFLHQVKIYNGIPFEVKTSRFSDDMIESISEAEEMEKNPEKYESFDSVEKFMEDLHNEIQN